MAYQERLYPILGADQNLDASTWAARKMAHYKGIIKPFRLNQASGDELLNLMAGIKDVTMIGYSKTDHSYVVWPGQGDVKQTSNFYG